MTLVPLYQWQSDSKTGKAVHDDNGNRIPHKRAGQRKDAKDLTKEEAEDIEYQERSYKTRKQAEATAVLTAINEARRTVTGD